MRIATLAAGLVALTLAAPTVPAAPFTSAFDALRTELEQRRDEDYAGKLDKARKKELRAVLRSLRILERVSDGVDDDLRSADKIWRLLEKAFPGEFAPAGDGQVLGDLLDGVLDYFYDRLALEYAELEGRLGDLSEEGAAAVQGALDEADLAFDAFSGAGTFSEAVKALLAAHQALLDGRRLADQDIGIYGEPLACLLDGEPWVATHVRGEAEIDPLDYAPGLELHGDDEPERFAWGTLRYFHFDTASVNAPGEYSISVAQGPVRAWFEEWQYVRYPEPNPYDSGTLYKGEWLAVSGTMTVTVFDPPRRLAGSFTFTAAAVTGDAQWNLVTPAVRTVTHGTFDFRKLAVR